MPQTREERLAKKRAYMQEYNTRPEVIAKRAVYNQQPEVIANRKAAKRIYKQKIREQIWGNE